MNKIRTKPVKGVIIFAAIAALVSAGAIILFVIDRDNLFISILVFIFGGMFFLGGIAIILDQLFHYVELKEDNLINHVIFKRHEIPVSKIKKITLVKGMYEIYTKNKKFCTIPSHLEGCDKIMVGLSRQGLEIEEKN